MSDAAQYAYLHSRVSLFAERLFAADALRSLIEHSPEQRLDVLTRAGVPQLIEEVLLAPRMLEQALITVLITEANILIRSLTGASRSLLVHWMRRFELINLKTIIRGKLAGWSPEAILEGLVDLGNLTALPVADLIHTEDVAESLRRLEHSQYAGMARYARQAYEEKHDLFGIEAVLDRHYYVSLAKRLDGLGDRDRRQLRPLTGKIMDKVNLVWLLRYRFSYGLSPPHAYFLLGPPGVQLTGKDLLLLAQSSSLEQAIQQLPPALNALLAHATTISAVERILDQQIEYTANRILRRTTFNLARAFAFLWLREKQMMGIHIVLKGHQLKLNRGLIEDAASLREE